MIFKLISKAEDNPVSDSAVESTYSSSSSNSEAREFPPSIQERIEQLEEMRDAIAGFAESGNGGSAKNGHVRRLGGLSALLEKMEVEARKTGDLELEIARLKNENANLRDQLASADGKVGSDDILIDSLRRQLDQTRKGLTSATADLETQAQRVMMLEAKIKSGKSRQISQQTKIDELHVALEAEKAERVLAARNLQRQKEEALIAGRNERSATKAMSRLELKLERSHEVVKSKEASIKKQKEDVRVLNTNTLKLENQHRRKYAELELEIASLKKALIAGRKHSMSLEKQIERKNVKIASQTTKIKGLQASNRKLSADKKSKPATSRKAKA